MRRTATQAQMAATVEMGPFTEVCRQCGHDVKFDLVGKNVHGVFFDNVLRGYVCSLSTMSNMRGIQDSEITTIIYDEFIAQPEERPIRHEAAAWLNACETFNRNRELSGKPPIQCVLLSNSNEVANPIYIELEIVSIVERMLKEGREYWIDKDKGMLVVYPLYSPISERKHDTALYRLAGDGSFTDMALNNKFADIADHYVKRRPLKEFAPIVAVGELTVYAHKSRGEFYITRHRSGSPPLFPATSQGLELFRIRFRRLWIAYLDGSITFDSAMGEALFRKYMSMKI